MTDLTMGSPGASLRACSGRVPAHESRCGRLFLHSRHGFHGRRRKARQQPAGVLIDQGKVQALCVRSTCPRADGCRRQSAPRWESRTAHAPGGCACPPGRHPVVLATVAPAPSSRMSRLQRRQPGRTSRRPSRSAAPATLRRTAFAISPHSCVRALLEGVADAAHRNVSMTLQHRSS